MDRRTKTLGKMKLRLARWLLLPQSFVYSAFAGALVGGAVGEAIDALVAARHNSRGATALMLVGALVVCLSGVFLLRIADTANLIDRLVSNYIAVQGKEEHEVTGEEAERYERDMEKEHGARVPVEFACFLISLVVGVFLTVLGYWLDC